jgi:hypothetical protein
VDKVHAGEIAVNGEDGILKIQNWDLESFIEPHESRFQDGDHFPNLDAIVEEEFPLHILLPHENTAASTIGRSQQHHQVEVGLLGFQKLGSCTLSDRDGFSGPRHLQHNRIQAKLLAVFLVDDNLASVLRDFRERRCTELLVVKRNE